MTDHQDLELVEPEKVHLPFWKEDDLSDHDESIGYPISLKKFALYLFCSYFAFNSFFPFLFCWSTLHFRNFVRAGSKGTALAMICSCSLPISLFQLCALYDEKSNNRSISLKLRKRLLPSLYLTIALTQLACLYVIAASYFHPEPYSFLYFDLLSLLPLFFFQYKINYLNTRLHPEWPASDGFTKPQIAGTMFCLFLGTFFRFILPTIFSATH